MNQHTIYLLNRLNRLFYQTTASSFDETRAHAWQGWQRLLPFLVPGLRVLDLGCGNGRFGVFLQEKGILGTYTGIDSSTELLEKAARALPDAHLIVADLLEYVPEGQYDLVTAFGVLHHIPGEANRRALLEAMLSCTTPGGVVALAFWVFYEHERLRERIIPWDAPTVPPEYHQLDLEPGDYLLDWRRGAVALRYCHYVDAAEMARLIAGFEQIETFEADAANRYVLLRRFLT